MGGRRKSYRDTARNLARDGASMSVSFRRGATTRLAKYAVSSFTTDGVRGDYVTLWVASRGALGQTLALAPRLIGKDARERIAIYEDLKRDIRQFDHMGHGPIDIALWDILGQATGLSVGRLLGGRYRERVQPYCSLLMEEPARKRELWQAMRRVRQRWLTPAHS